MNLAPAERAVAKLMQDDCVITRDPEGVGDDTYDRVTMQYTKPTPDELEIYAGKCLVTPTPLGNRPAAGGTVDNPGEREYRALIRRDADDIPTGATLTVTASVRDPLLVDAKFTVVGQLLSSFSVARQLDLRRQR